MRGQKGWTIQTCHWTCLERIYEATRAGIIHLARQHYTNNGHLEFVHSETGVRTLRDEFDKVPDHNEHHLAQIEIALARK